MEENIGKRYRLIKLIIFVIITFAFAFFLFTGSFTNLIQKSGNNVKKPETIDVKKAIIGSWQLVEINSDGTTTKVDISKEVPPESFMVYVFFEDRIDLYWENTKTILTYKWISADMMETIQPAETVEEKDYTMYAQVKILDDKLFMTATDEEKNKSEGVFVRFKGQLPKTISE